MPAMAAVMKPRFFKSTTEFRKWLSKNHATATELWVGYYKAGTGSTGMTYMQSVEEALCFGWIDGIRKSIDDKSYTNRFTPRKPTSTWSAVNITLVEKLIAENRMTQAGLTAYSARKDSNSAIYSYEKRPDRFPAELEERFRKSRRAWNYYQKQPPWYRRTTLHWVTSAKKEETRLRRLAKLIEDSSVGQWIGPLARPAKSG